jgi:DNA-binding NarL/FixJ family response regulator
MQVPRELELSLPPRLCRVAGLALQGCSNREIASALSLSVKTVENYMTEILASAGVRRRTELMALLWRILDANGDETL